MTLRRHLISRPSRAWLAIALAAVAVVVLAGAGTEIERRSAQHALEESRAAQRMLTAMLDRQSGLSGFALARSPALLEPYVRGGRDFDAALARARSLAEGDDELAALGLLERRARRWEGLARAQVVAIRDGRPVAPAQRRRARQALDSFRVAAERFDAGLRADRRGDLRMARWISAAGLAVLLALLAGGGYGAVRRGRRRDQARREAERERRRTQAELIETLRVVRSDEEARTVLETHLERTVPGSAVVLIDRDESGDRPAAATPAADGSRPDGPLAGAPPADEPPLTGRPAAEAGACLAVRLGQTYEEGGDADPLLRCELCGHSAADVVCTPALVGGEVTGSVLLRAGRPLGDAERAQVAESVAQAAPVLERLRTLAIAEARASTDELTGLPSSRACREQLELMTAHAARAGEPLSVGMLDVDDFKRVNDSLGHRAGDDLLVAVGEALRSLVRGSDFAGRYGGDEILLLMPGTDRPGAVELADKLRQAIAAIDLDQPDLAVTASIGIATYPTDAHDAAALLRAADRALYVAKARGRDTVAVAETDARH